MKLLFEKKFLKEVSNLNDAKLQTAIEEIINESERAQNTSQIKNIKKLKGFKNAYRIRVGEYRIGILVEKSTIIFVRFMHRKEVYKYFP